jgi:ABC-2 type transport system ATP-binding protein
VKIGKSVVANTWAKNKNMIKIEKLRKSYGNKMVLADVSVNVPKGTCLGLVGRNGSGKSTLLKLLSGAEEADGGSTYFEEEEIEFPMQRPLKMQLGVSLGTQMLMQDLSGKEYLEFVGGLYGVNDLNLKIYELRECLHFTDDYYFNQVVIESYSMGMQKKVSIMAALMHEPKYLLLDEIFSSLDYEVVQSLIDYLKKLKKSTTVLLTSHVLNYLEEVCDNIALIRDGRIQRIYDKEHFSEILGNEFYSPEV